MKTVEEVLRKYTLGEAGKDETNDGLKELGSPLRLNPDRNVITPEELAETRVGETPAEANGWGILDHGVGSLEKVHVVNGRTVDVDMGHEAAYVYIAGRKYRLRSDVLSGGRLRRHITGPRSSRRSPRSDRWGDLSESGPVPKKHEPRGRLRVHYPDGYESWSPKGVFEQAHLPMTVNPDLRTDAPSISQQMVDDFILETWTQTMGDKTTVVRAMLRNGFEIMESSACVSAENYDEKLGREICLGKIKDKVWFLLGFLLQTAVHGVKKAKTEAGRPAYAMTFGMAIEAAKKGKRIARKGWNGKGQYVELAKAISYKSPTGAVVNAEHDAIGNQALAFVGTSGVQMGWLASQADMLADDWEIVEG